MTHSINDTTRHIWTFEQNNGLHYAECRYAEYHVLFTVMLIVIMLNVVMLSANMLNIFMLSAITLNIVMLSVVAHLRIVAK
jgi:hypothetical protein